MRKVIRIIRSFLFLISFCNFNLYAQDSLKIERYNYDGFGLKRTQISLINIYFEDDFIEVKERIKIENKDSTVVLTSFYPFFSEQFLVKYLDNSNIPENYIGIYAFSPKSSFIIKEEGSCLIDRMSSFNVFCGIFRCFQYFQIDSIQSKDSLLIIKKWITQDSVLFHEENIRIVKGKISNIDVYHHEFNTTSQKVQIMYQYKNEELKVLEFLYNFSNNTTSRTTIKINKKRKKVIFKIKSRRGKERIRIIVSNPIDLIDLIFQPNNFFVLPSIPIEEKYYFWLGTRRM